MQHKLKLLSTLESLGHPFGPKSIARHNDGQSNLLNFGPPSRFSPVLRALETADLRSSLPNSVILSAESKGPVLARTLHRRGRESSAIGVRMPQRVSGCAGRHGVLRLRNQFAAN